MPNWKTHIEIAKRIGKYLNYDENKLNMFIYGNILPDINNGYLISNLSKNIKHNITHFKDDTIPTYKKFYNKYKIHVNKDNPIFLGYYVHLYTDYKFNNIFYESIKGSNLEGENHNTLRIMKQNDFRVYNNKFINNSLDISNINNVCINESYKIEEVFVMKGDVEKVSNFLNHREKYKAELLYFSEKELDQIFENIINDLKVIIDNDI